MTALGTFETGRDVRVEFAFRGESGSRTSGPSGQHFDPSETLAVQLRQLFQSPFSKYLFQRIKC